jgi:hypothetical protein
LVTFSEATTKEEGETGNDVNKNECEGGYNWLESRSSESLLERGESVNDSEAKGELRADSIRLIVDMLENLRSRRGACDGRSRNDGEIRRGEAAFVVVRIQSANMGDDEADVIDLGSRRKDLSD